MIVPSIDLQAGNAVQLVGGEKLAIDAGDPRPIADSFGRVGEVAVIDLDAALSVGDNTATIEALLQRADCRVGGGIRSVDAARSWLDRGAAKVILGTAARPDVLQHLPPERVIVALDARDGEVVVEGWRTGTGARILDRMAELRGFCSGFLVTFVEREGRLGGTDLDRVAALVQAAGDARVTIAGGVTTPAEVAQLDALGADAQVGMALYSGRFSIADATWACLTSDRPDGLVPTTVCDTEGRLLGLAWSSAESLAVALNEGVGCYWSRKRGLWRKGATSGATQRLLRVDADCDRDALRFTVAQSGAGFCHLDTATCFGVHRGIAATESVIHARLRDAPAGSYTARLRDDPALLGAKLREEADELALAGPRDEVVREAADLLYFTLTRLAAAGADLSDVGAELEARRRKVTRRPGDAKPGALAPKGD